MSALAEAIISAFDSNAKLIWTTAGPSQAIARFKVVGAVVETTFTATSSSEV